MTSGRGDRTAEEGARTPAYLALNNDITLSGKVILINDIFLPFQ
jgi:hypothetical protein